MVSEIMLKGTADVDAPSGVVGNGLYQHVTDSRQITGAFGELVGGALKTRAATDIKLVFTPQNGCVISAIDTDYLVTVDDSGVWTYNVPSILIEEDKTAIIKCRIPEKETPETETYIQSNMRYTDYLGMPQNNDSSLSLIRVVDEPPQTVPELVNITQNRIITAKATQEARNKASQGNYNSAKSTLENAINKLKQSNTKNHSSVVMMANQMNELIPNMSHAYAYQQVGRFQSATLGRMHAQQSSGSAYRTHSAKMHKNSSMKSKVPLIPICGGGGGSASGSTSGTVSGSGCGDGSESGSGSGCDSDSDINLPAMCRTPSISPYYQRFSGPS